MTDHQDSQAGTHAAHAVGEKLAALLADYADHETKVRQFLAREEMADARDVLAARKRDTRRKIIVGGAVLAEARTNPQFGTLLYELLYRRVEDPRDRALIAEGPSRGQRERQAVGPAEFIPTSPVASRPTAADFDAMAAAISDGRDADES
jgi:hypothetical protein